jgi:hypothetical protein
MGIVTLNDSVGPLVRLGGGARGPAVFSDMGQAGWKTRTISAP